MGIYDGWTPPSAKRNVPRTAVDRADTLASSAMGIAGRAEAIGTLYEKAFKLREADLTKTKAQLFVMTDDIGRQMRRLKDDLEALISKHQEFRDRLSWEASNFHNDRRKS